MKKSLLATLSVFALALSGCAGVHHDIGEYILEVNWTADNSGQDEYRILHLTDLHIGDKDNFAEHAAFMDKIIDKADADFIVVTGDLFTFASRLTAKRLFGYFQDKGINWTVTFGNHDEQCYFSVDWMTSYLMNLGGNCIYKDIQDDDIHGNCNFAVNVMKDGDIFEQLIIMDSGRYYFGDYIGYDHFYEDQITWYENIVKQTTLNNGGNVAPSLMFYHIPLPEIVEARDPQYGDVVYEGRNPAVNEKSCNPDKDPGFFDNIVELGSTTGMYFGHDHYNDFIVNYKGIDFGYGIKSTDRVYFDEQMLGGRVIKINQNHHVSYEHLYSTYASEEVVVIK